MILASFLHLVLIFFLISYDPIEVIEEQKTIPVMLINSTASQASVSQQQASASQASEASPRELITSKKQSSYQVNQSEKTTKEPPKNVATEKSSNSSLSPSLPNIAQNVRRQTNQANQTSKQWQSLTQQRQSQAQRNSPASLRQESTTESEELSEYEQKLRQHLARGERYAPYNDLFVQYNIKRVNLKLSLQLLGNGQIKKVDFISSSTIESINSTIRKIIYDANPFPRPPPEDISKRFTYEFSYQIIPNYSPIQ